MNIETYARGQDCLIRIPGVCSGNNEQTVPCHINLMGYRGMAIKMPSLFIAFGCLNCHDAIDRRRYLKLDRDYVRICALEGMIRTQAYILENAPELIVKLCA